MSRKGVDAVAGLVDGDAVAASATWPCPIFFAVVEDVANTATVPLSDATYRRHSDAS
jgi:hypothetical protein